MNGHEIAHYDALAQRISQAATFLFGDRAMAHAIREKCRDYQRQCNDIVSSRGIAWLTVAIVGAKGQGKSWIARQFVIDPAVRGRLSSGVLSREATTKLHWIGPNRPESLDDQREVFHYCDRGQLLDLGQPYLLIDTPGITDADQRAAQVAKETLSLAPVKLLVMRRDQMRSAINSQISAWIEGSVCVPVLSCVPIQEFNAQSNAVSSESLRSDITQLLDSLRASAPQSKLLEPVLIPDFEATGDEVRAGADFTATLKSRLQNESLEELAMTRANRLSALTHRLQHEVGRLVESETPQLAEAVRRMHEETDRLPGQVVESLLGATVVLETAVRGRLRAQMISDTSPLWFPYRTVISVLGFTQGAWDRVVLALSGSVPSLFGALATWARNVQKSREISTEMQTGIRDRLKSRIEDRLTPINRQFYVALSRLQTGDAADPTKTPTPNVRLGGIEELQGQSVNLFESAIAASATNRIGLQCAGMLATAMFWGMLSGPIVSVYRQYFEASRSALTAAQAHFDEFPHPSGSLLATSIFLSLLPMLIFAMIFMTWTLRRSRIQRISRRILAEHHTLIGKLKSEGVLKLYFEDPKLEQAEFLLRLDRMSRVDRGQPS